MNKNVGRVFGMLGALLLVFSILSFFAVSGEFNWMVWGPLAAGVAFLGAYFATALDDLQNIATGRGTIFVVTNIVAVIALIGVLVGVNYKAYKSGKEWDVTKDQIHTLAEQTQTMVKGLTDSNKVMVYAFFQSGEQGQAHVEDLLHRYKILNPDHFDYQFMDFYKDGAAAKQMNVSQSGPRVIFKSANGKEARAKEPTEEALTNALAELGHGVEKKVYFLTGDGEKPLTDEKNPLSLKGYVDQLKNEGFKTAELNLLSTKEVPSDAAALVIAGPRTDLFQGELDAIKNYANNGGRLALYLDPGGSTSLDALVKTWGADPMPGVILDTNTPEAVLAIGLPAQDSTHPILKGATNMVMGPVPSVFPDSRGIRKGTAGGYTVTELYRTTDKSWSEGDAIDPTGQKASEPGGPNDVPGPICVGVAVSKKDGDKEFRAVVFGDSDFLSNQWLGKPGIGNRDLALNVVSWLGGEEQKITIRPKMREKSTVTLLTKEKVTLLSFASLIILPFLLIASGLSVWVTRKSL